MSNYTSYRSAMGERKLNIGTFTGLNQGYGIHCMDYGSSPDSKNFICRYDRLYTAPGSAKYGESVFSSNYSCGRLFQAYFRDKNNNDITKLIMALDGCIYGADIDASNWSLLGSGYSTDDWDSVNYRDESNDWFILSNGTDGSFYIDLSFDGLHKLSTIQGKVDSEERPSKGEEIHFSRMTLLNERLWGGVSPDYPDRVYWSNSFDPNDWEFNYVDSENDGGGFADVATFDGGRVRAVINAFDNIFIFKDKSMHRLAGTYPGEFALNQVYGSEGTLAPRSIVFNGSKLWFLTNDGLCVYDGTSVSSLAESGDRKLKEVWGRVNPSSIYTACSIIKDSIMYIAIPLDGASYNTHVIEYDISSGYYSLVELPGVDDWLVLREGQLETLYYLDGGTIYSYGTGYNFRSGSSSGSIPIEAYWTSPTINCGTYSSKKSTGRIYMEIDATSLDVNKKPSIKLTLFNDIKERFKVIPLKNGKNIIRKRIKLRGRTFRFKIENVDGNPLSINSGVEIMIEEDFD